MQDIDKDTIKHAAGGDIGAFERIFKGYSSLVYNTALRVVYFEADAKDVSQEVFTAIYRKLGEFKFQSTLKTWIYRITVNKALNHIKRRGARHTVSIDDNAPSSEPSSAQTVQDRELIELSLSRLTDDQRVCVVLRSIQGLSYSEIGAALGVDENVVRSRLKRAREKLAGFRQEVGI